MNLSIIADSSGLLSLISEDDNNHKIAIKVSEELSKVNALIVVPSDVYSETLNVIGMKFGHNLATDVIKEIAKSETYMIIETDESIREKTLLLFSSLPQSVSFTDCVVMTFAEKFATKNIFGFDEAFRKNGFNRLGFDKPLVR